MLVQCLAKYQAIDEKGLNNLTLNVGKGDVHSALKGFESIVMPKTHSDELT